MVFIIKFFSSFCDSQECKSKYERLCEIQNMPKYGKTISVTTGDDYTHAIILNTAMPVLKNIPKSHVIGLAFEPPQFLKLNTQFILYAQKYIGKYFIGDRRTGTGMGTGIGTGIGTLLPDVFKEHYSYMWHIQPLSYFPVKHKLMSIMVSNKKSAPGHKYRHMLVQHILNAGFPIDIYGRGAEGYANVNSANVNAKQDSRIKGSFTELEPYEKYKFHICIENFATNAYFSEKITNTLLCGATPIYWGCRYILDYFPKNVIVLSGDIVKDMTMLRDILVNPLKYTSVVDIKAIKDKLSLLNNAEMLFGKS